MEFRLESDSMGTVQVPADRYWGAQTQRSRNLSLKEAVLRLGLLSGEEFDRYVRPDQMVRP